MEYEKLKNLKPGTVFAFMYVNQGDFDNVFIARLKRFTGQHYNTIIHYDTLYTSKNKNGLITVRYDKFEIPTDFDKTFAKYYHISQIKIREAKSLMLKNIFTSSAFRWRLH